MKLCLFVAIWAYYGFFCNFVTITTFSALQFLYVQCKYFFLHFHNYSQCTRIHYPLFSVIQKIIIIPTFLSLIHEGQHYSYWLWLSS